MWPTDKSANSGETIPQLNKSQPEDAEESDPNDELDTLDVADEYWDASSV